MKIPGLDEIMASVAAVQDEMIPLLRSIDTNVATMVDLQRQLLERYTP